MKSSSRQRRVRPLKAKAATVDAAEFDNYGAEPNMKLSHAFMVVLALHVIAVGGLFAFNKVKAGHSKVSQKVQNELAVGQEAATKEEAKPLVSPAVPAAAHQMEKEIKKEIHQVAKVVESPAPLPPAVATKIKESPTPVASIPTKKTTPTPVAPVLTSAQKAFLATKEATAAAPSTSSSGAVAAVATMASPTAMTAEGTAVQQAAPVESVAAIEYTIVKGDNPYKLAKRFHVPYSELIKFNNISDPRKIQIGQKLRIPKKS